jgi:hypothetical protein
MLYIVTVYLWFISSLMLVRFYMYVIKFISDSSTLVWGEVHSIQNVLNLCSSVFLDFYTTVNNISEIYLVHICLCGQYNIIWIEETWSRGHETSTSHWSTLSYVVALSTPPNSRFISDTSNPVCYWEVHSIDTKCIKFISDTSNPVCYWDW